MSKQSIEILLGSQSPRRRALITLLGLPVVSIAADAAEDSIDEPDPALNVILTAALKTAVITQNQPVKPNMRTILITADTTVSLAGVMLNKPVDEADARHTLQTLAGRSHQVHSGYVVTDLSSGMTAQGVNTAIVTMRNYLAAEIDAYIATGDPMDKAGAYAIQHPTFRPVAHLEGCYLSVMGLPLCDLLNVLPQFELPLNVKRTAVAQAHQQHPCPILQNNLH
jgi:MAF protein